MLKSSSSEYGLYFYTTLIIFCADCMHKRDTVDSVGLIPRRLPFTKVDDNIKYFRHAIALDERRV